MNQRIDTHVQKEILSTYVDRTPASRAAHQKARNFLPGGVNRNILYHDPHPLFVARGEGAYIEDVDQNRYLDLIGNYTSMILGHRHPSVIAAVEGQLRMGTAWAGASLLEAKLASMLTGRLPAVERIRFTASGTEAAMMAIRAARVVTGRPKIAKFEGGYHGLYDDVMVSVAPDVASIGPDQSPAPDVPAGLNESARRDVVVLPFNQPALVDSILAQQAAEIAALIVEPVMGVAGVISPEPDFLAHLRRVTHDHGIVLIFDEVISLRLDFGGAQKLFGVLPDLTVLGKVIGGGFPIGAVGGTREIIDMFNPESGGRVLLSGTFHAGPVILAAGIATMKELTQAAIARLNAMARELLSNMRTVFEESRVPVRITEAGSLFHIHATSRDVKDYRSAASDRDFSRLLYFALLNEGVMISPRGMGCLSTPMGDQEATLLLNALTRALSKLGAPNRIPA